MRCNGMVLRHWSMAIRISGKVLEGFECGPDQGWGKVERRLVSLHHVDRRSVGLLS